MVAKTIKNFYLIMEIIPRIVSQIFPTTRCLDPIFIICQPFPNWAFCFRYICNPGFLARIMHQDRFIADKVGMEILHLKVIDLDRCFQQLVLHLLNRDQFAI